MLTATLALAISYEVNIPWANELGLRACPWRRKAGIAGVVLGPAQRASDAALEAHLATFASTVRVRFPCPEFYPNSGIRWSRQPALILYAKLLRGYTSFSRMRCCRCSS